jgi:tetratricopeptide (TPR) repeat protein
VNQETAIAADRLGRLQQMLRTDPANLVLRRQCVELATTAGRFDVVVGLADAVLDAHPTDAAALFDKATGLIGQRAYRDALEVLQRSELVDSGDGAVLSNMGLCSFFLGDFAAAKRHLEQCYAGGARSPALLVLLVSSCHHVGALDEALRIAGENEQAAANDAALAGVYALAYLDANDAARAAGWAKTALRLNPQSVDGRVTEATLLTARLQTDRARQLLEGVIEDAPATGRAWIGLGTLTLLDQRMELAQQQLRRGLELMPQHVGSWHLLGWAQLVAGELDAAEATFQHALQMDRNFAETHGALATIAALRGEQKRAQAQIAVALRLDPESMAARYAQAVLSGRTGQAGQAQSAVLELVEGLAAKDGSALSKLLLKTNRRSQ